MKKFLSLILAVLMVATGMIAFASCAKEENVLVMATNAAFPPYEYVEGGEFVGIDVEIANAIANKLGMKLEIKDVDFGAIIGGVQSGKFDMGMAGMTVTDERLESVNFSTSYATGIQVVIVAEGSSITSLDDLVGGLELLLYGFLLFGAECSKHEVYLVPFAEVIAYAEPQAGV